MIQLNYKYQYIHCQYQFYHFRKYDKIKLMMINNRLLLQMNMPSYFKRS